MQAQDSYAVLQKEQLDAAAAHESEASEIKTHATALQLELRQLQKGHQDLKRKNKGVDEFLQALLSAHTALGTEFRV